tara:strand:- start:5442 stop:5957 length:516 start_codon:yes stop_codon:yes gene_type:complete
MKSHTLLGFLLVISLLLTSCGVFKYSSARDNPTKGPDRARKNIEEGRGIAIGDALKRGGTTYQFSTSNPMWRASLEVLDFLPLTTVDYSGGMIITDWYSENSQNDSIKISVRFLSNEIASENLKILVHKKTCSQDNICKTSLLQNDKISQELLTTIIKKAALLEKETKSKK